MNQEILTLRKKLHQNPELSGCEGNTSNRIIEFIESNNPTKIIKNIGGSGLAAIYEFDEEGPVIVIRCELDALPIEEKNNFEYKSINKGISHKCGHDGHMAIVAGLIFWIKEQTFKSGKIVLLFQPAEETGEGAFKVLKDENFIGIKPDYIFSLHNLPGFPTNSIVLKADYFTATVQSMIITLKGKKAHASEPENGINPTVAASEIVSSFSKFANHNLESDDFSVITPIHVNIGEKTYGISPENAEIHYTLRTWSECKMKALEKSLSEYVTFACNRHNLKFEIKWFEYFPATKNDVESYNLIKKVALTNSFNIKEIKMPLRFGEDFGWFSKNYKAAMFGLGAGINHPSLHHSDYDFPEEIIETGIDMFKNIINEILK
ncbi:amidohydrolase [Maribacter antarcticus]|uniref:amidohydrolase n=1 Tax=Maribacter antarcticus TaxID=505250 RepID=UPI00047A4FE5|nr:amidohydrolase [Maribacter antarcticus]